MAVLLLWMLLLLLPFLQHEQIKFLQQPTIAETIAVTDSNKQNRSFAFANSGSNTASKKQIATETAALGAKRKFKQDKQQFFVA